MRLSIIFKFYLAELTVADCRIQNKKRAISRWSKVHAQQLGRINRDPYLLARLCGFLAGDGSIQIRTEPNGKIHHSLEFFPDDASLIPPFLNALENVYGVQPTIEKHPKHFRLRLYSKVVVSDLLSLAKFGIHGWTLPKTVLSDSKAKREWLRAYFDSEAYVGRTHIKVQSVNASGIYSVKQLLKEFEIPANVYEYKPKTARWNKVYILIIAKKVDRLNFLKRIGFNHKKKAERLLSYLDNADVA